MFKFRTFSSSALLMYLATRDLKDFMSVELTDGHVKVSYDLGSGMASVVSNQNHNDGKWKSFTLSRIQKQANISIVDIDTNQEESIATSSSGNNFGLDLKADDKIYFGGLPTLRNLSMKARPEVNLKKYSGCLKDIEISRTPYNILSSPDYVGVIKGCSLENVYTVSFPKPGFIELPPVPIDVGTEINLSFSTKNESGIILLGSGGTPTQPRRKRRQTGQAYYAIFLNKGRLEVHLSMGTRTMRKIVIKPEPSLFHDGREHSVHVERTKGTFTVQVDEDRRHTQNLTVEQAIQVKKLFVGGAPPEFQPPPLRNIPPFEASFKKRGTFFSLSLILPNRFSSLSKPQGFFMRDINWYDKKFLHKMSIARVTYNMEPFKSSNCVKHNQEPSVRHEVHFSILLSSLSR